MVSIYDVEPRKLIDAAATELKKMPELAPPEWANYVKTGVHNERPPAENDWWYVRSASILRTIYKFGPIGVSKLRTKYGGRKNRGHAPDKTFKASGNIIRKILQKLELIGFIKQDQIGVHKGRVLTPKGESFMDKLVVKIKDPYKKPTKKVNEAPAKKEEKIVKIEKPQEKPVDSQVKEEEKTPKVEKKLKKAKEDKPKEVKVEQEVKPPKAKEEPKTEKEDKPVKVEEKTPENKKDSKKPVEEKKESVEKVDKE